MIKFCIKKEHCGFTIIELLIVIAIIGLLVSVVLASFDIIRRKSRDARRIQDVQEIKKALSLYQITNNKFPISVSTTTLNGSDPISTKILNSDAMDAIPLDPLNPTYVYEYSSDNVGGTYMISFCLETNTIPNYSEGCGNIITP